MDNLVENYLKSFLGDNPFSCWTGCNIPTEIEKQSNIWVAKAGARISKQGFNYDPEVSPMHFEWGAMVDGEMLLNCEGQKIKINKGMFYLMPDSVKMTASALNDHFLVWIEFTGSLSQTVFEEIGGHKHGVLTGYYNFEQLKAALNIAYLLQYHPPHYNLNVHSMLWRFIAGHSDAFLHSRKFSEDIQKAIDHIHLMADDNRISVSELATASMLSVESFRKRFCSEVGEAPIQYLLRYRINKAKEQLLDSTKPIKQIAYESGFSDPYYFSRLFKKYEGLSPLLFRKNAYSRHEA